MKLYYFLAVSIILAIIAGILAYRCVNGWGWFLFGSIITFVYPSKGNDSNAASN